MIASIPVELVAWYGAALATLTLAIRFIDFKSGRARITVVADTNMMVAGDAKLEAEGPYIIITVVNVGRRPIRLRAFPGFELTREGRKKTGNKVVVVKGDWGPTDRPAEGESCKMLCQQKNLPPSYLRRAFVYDGTGKQWRGKIVRN